GYKLYRSPSCTFNGEDVIVDQAVVIDEEISGIKHSKVYTEGFTTSYYEYMNRLSEENFDIVVSPLFNVGPKLAKGLTKYIEAAVCGAI
ncbi:DUF1737 domain-containing protein, partial [Escherichia marmotae]|nr:DUF1737 domain-containing protein [Escherichia marmotae]